MHFIRSLKPNLVFLLPNHSVLLLICLLISEYLCILFCFGLNFRGLVILYIFDKSLFFLLRSYILYILFPLLL